LLKGLVNGSLGFGPKRSFFECIADGERPGSGLLILNRNREIAAIFTIRFAADPHTAAESKRQVSR